MDTTKSSVPNLGSSTGEEVFSSQNTVSIITNPSIITTQLSSDNGQDMIIDNDIQRKRKLSNPSTSIPLFIPDPSSHSQGTTFPLPKRGFTESIYTPSLITNNTNSDSVTTTLSSIHNHSLSVTIPQYNNSTYKNNNNNEGSISSTNLTPSSIRTPLKQLSSSSSSSSSSMILIPTLSTTPLSSDSLSPLNQVYQSLITNNNPSFSSISLPLVNNSNNSVPPLLPKIRKETLNDISNEDINETPTPISGTPLPFIQTIHNQHLQNHQSNSPQLTNTISTAYSFDNEKTSSSGGTMIVSTESAKGLPVLSTINSEEINLNSSNTNNNLSTIRSSTPIQCIPPPLRKPVYSVESLLTTIPPLHPETYLRYTWGLVCACNVNRSMSAHISLANQGFTKVYSYGTSDLVRLPSRSGPIPFYFGTSYTSMLNRLCLPFPEDSAWTTLTGLRSMLERDANIKSSPQQWQSLLSGGGPKPTEYGLIPPCIPMNNSPILGIKQILNNNQDTIKVIDHDFVICFDLRVYEQVILDLHYRGFTPSMDNALSDNQSSSSSPNNGSIISKLLMVPTFSFYNPNGNMLHSLPTANASSIPQNNNNANTNTSTTSSDTVVSSTSPKKRVQIILLHTRDNLADAAIAGRLATLLAQYICYAIEQKELEENNLLNNTLDTSVTQSTSKKFSWKNKFQQKLQSSTMMMSNNTVVENTEKTIENDARNNASSSTELSSTNTTEYKTIVDESLSTTPPIDETIIMNSNNPSVTNTTTNSIAINHIPIIRTVLRDIEDKLNLPYGCMLYEEWCCTSAPSTMV